MTRKTADAMRALRPSGPARPTPARPEDRPDAPITKGPTGRPVRRARPIAAPLAVLAAVGLAACAGQNYDPNLPQGCPQVSVLRDASEVTLFDGSGRDLTDVVARAAIGDYRGECDYVADPDRVEVTLILPIVAERGPAAEGGPVAVDYFVSVIDPEARVLGKQVFTTEIPFESGAGRGGSIEELAQVIPLPSLGAGEAYGIIVGFQLTPAQLRWNREQIGGGPAQP